MNENLNLSTHPDCYYTKEMFSKMFSVTETRASETQTIIKKQGLEHSPNGRGIVAPLSTWYAAMKLWPEYHGS